MGADAGPAVTASWSGLPPIRRALASGQGSGVADAGFGGRLPTWQNPSFMGMTSHAVLDGRSSAVLGDAPRRPTSGRPVSGLERRAGALPLVPLAPSAGSEPVPQRPPAVP
ncbi:hypothetical protein, partial [Streptomyces sp. WAC04114]|uniref:hypothetical protein n=1 Tax=Streptomyces sp. WAC04114 TaxID=2867961 RepID=UPI001C8C5BED